MNQKTQDYIDRIVRAETLDDLYDIVSGLRNLFEVEHTVYHSLQWKGDPFALATYSAEWAKHYETEQLYLVDPVVLNGFRQFNPYDWKSIEWDSKPARLLMRDAVDAGVGNQGLSMPIRGPYGELALMSVSHIGTDDDWSKFKEVWRNDLVLIANLIHEAARRLLLRDPSPELAMLSPREVDALTMLALGYNRASIADLLKISEHTLRVYIESSRRKMGATNTLHAVSTAMSNGLISV